MTNAREEFLEDFAEEILKGEILCAKIRLSRIDYETGNHIVWEASEETEPSKKEERTIILRKNFSKEDWENFLSQLDFEYDCGYGIQELFGTVWGVNNWWGVRKEYDGSEWWDKLSYPIFPPELQ